MSITQPTWIYAADGGAKMVDHVIGAPAPDGWSFDPGVIEDPALRTGDAISGVKLVVLYPEPEAAPGKDGAPVDACDDLGRAVARIAELEGFICEGIASNNELLAEVGLADADVARLTAELDETGPALADAIARGDRLEAALKASADEVSRAREANAPLAAAIARHEATIASMQDEIERLRVQKRGR